MRPRGPASPDEKNKQLPRNPRSGIEEKCFYGRQADSWLNVSGVDKATPKSEERLIQSFWADGAKKSVNASGGDSPPWGYLGVIDPGLI